MTMPIETDQCPMCGGTMRFETRDDVLRYRGHTRTIQSLAWWCDDCHDGIIEGDALADSEKAFFELKAEVDKLLGPLDVTQVRGKLIVDQRAAG